MKQVYIHSWHPYWFNSSIPKDGAIFTFVCVFAKKEQRTLMSHAAPVSITG